MTNEIENKIYIIGDQRFYQKPLVIGQTVQLMKELSKVKLTGGWSVLNIMDSVGDKIADLITIVLIQSGKTLKDKDRVEMSGFLNDNLSMDMAIEIVEDFFLCNKIQSLLDKVTLMMNRLQTRSTKS